jgi:hypothetical protein
MHRNNLRATLAYCTIADRAKMPDVPKAHADWCQRPLGDHAVLSMLVQLACFWGTNVKRTIFTPQGHPFLTHYPTTCCILAHTRCARLKSTPQNAGISVGRCVLLR